MREGPVLVVGAPMLDVTAYGADHFPRSGRTENIDRAFLGLGGCALNTAVILARLGVATEFAGRCGDDVTGRVLGDLLRREPLRTSRLRVVEDAATTICMVFVTRRGDRQFLFAGAAGEDVTVADAGELAGCSVVHVGAALQLAALDVGELFRRARAAGVVTTLDVENGPGLDDPRRLLSWLPEVDWFLPNEEEARRATGCADAEAAAAHLRGLGARGVVVKLGPRGCLIDADGGRMVVTPAPVEVVDTTGAGDAFVAGFIAGLVGGFTARDAAQLACACGARTVTALGATAAIRSFKDLLGLLPHDLALRLRRQREPHDPRD